MGLEDKTKFTISQAEVKPEGVGKLIPSPGKGGVRRV